MFGARLFIIVVYGLIGLSFIATTGVMVYEFWDLGPELRHTGWLGLATFYSHLFVFFPLFGIVALFAFYTPSVVFLDMYWRYVPMGRLRFVVGFFVVAGLAGYIALQFQSGSQRSLWEVSPAQLMADRGDPQSCSGMAGACNRLPVLLALQNLREVSQKRTGFGDLVRDCSPDPLVEVVETTERRRFCFASTGITQSPIHSTDRECCRAQRQFVKDVGAMADAAPSLTSVAHRWLLPLKVFFLLTLVVISIMLAARRKQLETYYPEYLGAIEKGVLIGALAMLFFPVMNHAFLQSAAMLYGNDSGSAYRGPAPYLSFGFGAWALLIVFFFYRRRDREVELLGRFGGVIASAFAIMNYNALISYFVRFAGSGAGLVELGILLTITLCLLFLLYTRLSSALAGTAIAGAIAGSAAAGDALAKAAETTASSVLPPGTGG